jgi:hypothetical protein
MLVYRVEHKEIGCGPYCPMLYKHVELHNMAVVHNDRTHPTLLEEHIQHISNWRHGFDSLEKLLTWFDGWFDTLARHNFHIAVYDAQEFKRAPIQCIFDPMESLLLDTITFDKVLFVQWIK